MHLVNNATLISIIRDRKNYVKKTKKIIDSYKILLDAEDVFFSIVERFKKEEIKDINKQYYTIVNNIAKDEIRKSKNRTPLTEKCDLFHSTINDPYTIIIKEEKRENKKKLLDKCVEFVDDKYKTNKISESSYYIFIKYYGIRHIDKDIIYEKSQYTQEELAKELNANQPNIMRSIKTILNKIYKQLRLNLEEYYSTYIIH